MGNISKRIVFMMTAFLIALVSSVIITSSVGIVADVGGFNILPVGMAIGGMLVSEFVPLPGGVLFYTMVSAPKVGSNPGRPVGKKDMVIFFNWDDVDIDLMPARDANGVKITGDLVFKAGKTAIEIYVTPSTVNFSNTGEGEVDGKGWKQKFECERPGDDLVFDEFLENNINSNLGIIVRFCDGRTPRLLGTPCVPLQLMAEGQNNNEANKTKLTLESTLPGPLIAHYFGADPPLDTDSGSGSGA